MPMRRMLILMIAVIGMFGSDAFAIYAPSTGRFMQRDPIGYKDGMNLYQYARSNPIRYNDPMGLIPPMGEFWRNVGDLTDDLMDDGNGYIIAAPAAKYIAIDSYFLGKHAWKETRKRFPDKLGDGHHNGKADAWRHCYWSCLMAAKHGGSAAEIIGNNHESQGMNSGQPYCETVMDDHNNGVGRGIGQQYPKSGSNKSHCASGCDKALSDGSLLKSPKEACGDEDACENVSIDN